MNKQYNRPGLTSRLRHAALAAVLATGATVGAQAQALNYPLANAQNLTSTYTDLGTSGTAITTSSTDDANSAEQLIGFNFAYNGATMDRFILNTNGFLKLGAAAGMTAPTVALYTAYAEFNQGGTLLGTAANDINLVSPFNYDLLSGTSAAEYRVATTGTAPNRICTIQWKNVADKAQLALAGGTSIPTQYANLSFQVRLYEANGTVEFVFGPNTPAPVANNNFKYAQMGLKGSGAGATQILKVTKGSTSPWGDAAVVFATGPVTAGATGAFNFRQAVAPDNGRTYRFVPSLPNDAGINQLYTINQLAVPGAAAHAVRALVGNNGTNALTNVVVTLNVTGANTFTNTQTIATLAAGATAPVTFAAYTPANQGTNTVTVSVVSDDNNTNNSLSETQVVNTSTFSYISPNLGATSAVGYPSGSENGFAAKFSLSAPRSVTAVRAFVFDAQAIPPTQKTTVGETLYGVVLDPTTGVILGRSANFVVTAADINAVHTFTLTSPVTVVAGDFMVGMVQVSPASNGAASFFPMGVQNESPTRAGTFYRFSAAGGAPTDAAAGTSRYLLEAVTAAPAANDIAVNEIQGYGSIAVPVGNPISMRAVVRNAGTAAQSNVVVTLNITGANTQTVTQTLPSLAVGATAQVTFSGITLANVGANTVTVTVPTDDVATNNSVAKSMATSATRFSFITPGATQSSAIGFVPNAAARSVAFCGKFTVNAPRDVTAVRAVIGNDPTLVTAPTTVFGVVLNATTGAVIARSADYLITTADLGQLHTFTLTGSVPTGDFLVGLAQVLPINGTQVSPMGYEDETPARPGTFYTASITAPGAPNDVAANNLRFMLEVETAAPATCLVPTVLSATSSTAATAVVSFTGRTGAIGYQIVYGPQGFTPVAGSLTTTTFTTTTYTVTGLTPGTAYDFYVRTICSTTDQSGLAGPVRATTACAAPTISTFPYTESFDVVATGQTLPCGITVSDNNADGVTWQARGSVATVPNSTSIARTGINAMVYAFNSTDPTVGANDWFYTPALALSSTQRYRLSFYYRGPVASGSNVYTNALEVKYGATATPAGQLNTLYTNNAIASSTYLIANNTSTPAVLDITPTTGNFYVGFHALSGGDQGFLAVDDVMITAGPLATSEALKRSVSVFPNPSTTGTFNLEIHGANAKQGLTVEVSNMLGQRVYTGTAKDNFSNTVNLSSLSSGIYSIKVRNGEEYTQQQISIVK